MMSPRLPHPETSAARKETCSRTPTHPHSHNSNLSSPAAIRRDSRQAAVSELFLRSKIGQLKKRAIPASTYLRTFSCNRLPVVKFRSFRILPLAPGDPQTPGYARLNTPRAWSLRQELSGSESSSPAGNSNCLRIHDRTARAVQSRRHCDLKPATTP
jgi:hypothetical protein